MADMDSLKNVLWLPVSAFTQTDSAMIQRLAKVGFCVAIATGIAMAMSVVAYFAYWPPREHLHAPELIWTTALLGAAYLAAVPLLILGLIGLRRAPGVVVCTALTSAWLLLLFLIRARHPWTYYGAFPGWMFMRDFVRPLPISLAIGLAFAVSARNVLGPDDRLRDPAWSGASPMSAPKKR